MPWCRTSAAATTNPGGRRGPPGPADPRRRTAGHPLHDPSIVRLLERSPHAAAIKADMQTDLHRLRKGTPLEHDLLGLVTAAEGGLSSADLEELATDRDITEWDIGQLLSTVAGRNHGGVDRAEREVGVLGAGWVGSWRGDA